ncbi:MAG TPA: [FeFe] hydrogenase H-cluster radical SAM maturase HydE [Candidatus Goldiibacteriota bacterium]|nr:[FeFe] hydrogenase H-cluster radical SAM maturase HydE [Candidatus Goldiibacteriota bacterium]
MKTTTGKILENFKDNVFNNNNLTSALQIENEHDFMPFFEYAEELCEANFAKNVYIRGIIEFSNNCRRNCSYCGIRRANLREERYRMSLPEILDTAGRMRSEGIMTAVLQGGEDIQSDNELITAIAAIKAKYDMAVTVSIGERSASTYARFRDAGADRFLLRIETTDKELFRNLHPDDDFDERMNCLHTLKSLGFETGTGIMTGLPGQTMESIANDLLFFREFKPEMVGLGPFLPHKYTPLSHEKGGGIFLALKAMALTRILLPGANIPATTAMGTADPKGREKALKYGANVIMPNYTPLKYREHYMLYDNKICTGEMCARACSDRIAKEAGKKIVESKGYSKIR